MRVLVSFVLVLSASVAQAAMPAAASAQRVVIDGRSQDSIVSFVPRIEAHSAIRSITSRSGHMQMLHRDGAMVLQLTDAGLENIGRRAESAAAETGLGRILEAMLHGGLRALLDRAMVYDLSDVGDVRYEHGEIVFENRRGERVFGDFNVHGEQVMASFDEREARAFVAHLKRSLPK
jgi:hypothetical protein